jgi:hypothetical protein
MTVTFLERDYLYLLGPAEKAPPEDGERILSPKRRVSNKNLSIYLVFLRSVRRLLVAACVVPSSPIFVTLMKQAPGSSETPVITRATRRNNPEDTILHCLYIISIIVTLVLIYYRHTPIDLN